VGENDRFLGVFFEDIIDGYFPLKESFRQLLIRQGLDFAIVFFIFAPVLKNNKLRKDSPVPLHITPKISGMITNFAALVELSGADLITTGVADWFWENENSAKNCNFFTTDRLAEPAFVRGMGLIPRNCDEAVGDNQGKVSDESDTLDSFQLTEISKVSRHNLFNFEVKTTITEGDIVRGEISKNGNSIVFAPADSIGQVHLKNYQIKFENSFSNRTFLNHILFENKIKPL